MKSQVLLMNNGNVITTNDWKSYYDDIDYILICTDDQLNIYGGFKINNYLFYMDKATVKYEMILVQKITSDVEFDKRIKAFGKVNKEFVDPLDLLAYIHSLDRIHFYNEIISSGIHPLTDKIMYEEVQFCYFRIDIYSKGKRTFHYKNNTEKEKTFIKERNILMDIAPIYHPLYADYQFIVINSYLNKWRLDSKIIRDCLNGIPLETSNSYIFLTHEDAGTFLSKVECMFCQFFISNKTDDDITSLESEADKALNSIYYYDSTHLLEFNVSYSKNVLEMLIYLPYIQLLFQTIKEIWDNGECVGNYLCKTNAEFYINKEDNEYEDKTIEIYSTINQCYTLEDFMNEINNMEDNNGFM